MQNKDFLLFLKELEFKIKFRHLNNDEKIKEFFKSFNFVEIVGNDNIPEYE